MSARRFVFGVFALAASAAAPSAHAYFDDVAVGGRALATGKVAGAWVEDVTAYYWNPAALARLEGPEVFFGFGRPHGVSDLNKLSAALGTRSYGTGVVFAWHRLTAAEIYSEDLFHLAAGRELARSPGGHALAAGVALKLGRVGFDPFEDPDDPNREIDFGSETNLSADLGLLWITPWRLDVAWTFRDVLSPSYDFVAGEGGSEVEFRNELAAVFHWNPESSLLFGWQEGEGETGSEVNLGVEVWFYDVFAVRSGLTDVAGILDPNTPATEFQYTGGVGLKHEDWLIDAAVTTNRDLGASFQITLRVPLEIGSSR